MGQMVVEDFETTDCVRFVQCARVALNMFTVESRFVTKIIDSSEKIIMNKLLERIFEPVLRYLNNDAEVRIRYNNYINDFIYINYLQQTAPFE